MRSPQSAINFPREHSAVRLDSRLTRQASFSCALLAICLSLLAAPLTEASARIHSFQGDQSMLEHIVISLWNRFARHDTSRAPDLPQLDLGFVVADEEVQGSRAGVPEERRAEHIAILGKTGQGKSFLLRHMTAQDIRARKGFVFFDLHGDIMPYLLRRIAHEEQRRNSDLSTRLILIEPGDREWSIGLNVLESQAGEDNYVQLAEFAQILKSRWHLDSFGARTEELLRNALLVLADNQLTLLDLGPLLSNAAFRTACLNQVRNTEVLNYFRTRFDPRSEAQQGVFRDAILNKISAFTTDVRFRHILGQQRSTFSLLDAMDRGYWVIVNLDKGRLGEQAATLGSLLLTKLKNALFQRQSRQLFTFFCDEIQNLVAYDSGLDTLLSEARKFGVSVVSANQFLDQYPPQMRSAVMAVGSHVFFQLSSPDADKIAGSLDGGKRLAESLRNLPKRHLIVKSGSDRYQEALVPTVNEPVIDYSNLYNRCRARWARRRVDVEAEIQRRYQQYNQRPVEVLRAWD
jgi:hypothetical protein